MDRIRREAGQTDAGASPDQKAKMQAQQRELEQAPGTKVDQLFLKHMIDHHSEEVAMMHKSLPNLQRQDLRQMTEKMIEDQQRDIEQMRPMQRQ